MEEPQGPIGTVLGGRYRVTGVVGAGAMGAVYRADDVERGTPVAVKLLHKQLGASPEASARFKREAFVNTQMQHPNCVAVEDSGVADDGSFFLVMELLQGESLGDLLDRERRLPWRRALRIARHVLRGLEQAHGLSVVHRDIKPDNIFITPRDGDPDFAKILDFGIAKLVGDSAAHALTAAGITVGTPKYLSPEQATGGTLDGRSDLYSLSIVLYEMLTGRTPFGDREPLKILFAHTRDPVPAFAEVAPDLDVPPDVEALVHDGLAKRPDDRIASAGDYVARIDAILEAHAPRRATPPPLPRAATPPPPRAVSEPPPRRRRRGRRTGVAIGAIGAVVLLAVAGAVVIRGGWLASSSSAAPAIDAPPAVPAEVTAAIEQLETGKTCAARRNAVRTLRTLGHPAAIPALEKAKSRPRRGKNTNACLRAEAAAAIAELAAR